MQKGGQVGKQQRGWRVAAVACLVAVSGCNLRPSAPESRAVYFVEKFVREPHAVEDLSAVIWLSAGQTPDMLLADVPTRTAIVYLRARANQQASLGFHSVGIIAAKGDRRVIQVSVSEGMAIGGADPIRFDVELEKRDAEWRVIRLHAD